jgi:SNF2 family DNA or RNA helicase
MEITCNRKVYYLNKLFYSDLYEHQVLALHWLLEQHSNNMGSILADEMGLGKTISAIALLTTLYTTAMEKEKNSTLKRKVGIQGPTLVVCPATMVN